MRLLGVLLAYAGGLGCAPFFDPSPLFPGAAVASACLWFFLRYRRIAPLCLAIFFFSFGLASYFQHVQPPPGSSHIRSFVDEDQHTIEGEISRIATRPEGRTEIVLEASRIFQAGESARIHGRVLLRIDKGATAAFAGDSIRFRSRLRQPRLFATPGEFDYPRHLAAQNIFVTAFLPDSRDLAIFPREETFFRFAALQHAATSFIDKVVIPEQAPLVRALVTGDSGGITPEQRDLLSRSGLSHLFSISGLHLGLIALFLYLLARLLYCRSERLLLWSPPRRALPLLLLPALWFYLQLTGDALPTRRAFLMAVAGAILLVICRRTQPLKILTAAALLILLAAPLALFEPSFQLSFAGILGILFAVPHWQERLRTLPPISRWAATLILTTLAATVATTPLVLWHFHILAPAGLLTNMVAVPAISFLAVPLGLIGMLAIPWWPQGSTFLLQGCGLVVEAMVIHAEQITAWKPLGGWQLYLTPVQNAAVFILAVGLLLLAGAPRGRRIGMGLLLTGYLLLAAPAPPLSELTISALSVGQGESILVSVPPGRHYLIDGGGLTASNFDIGERLLAPALGRLGVRRLEAIVLTHDHPDHRLGLRHVLKSLPVAHFWTATPPARLDSELATILRQRDIPVRQFPLGWTAIDRELSIFVPSQGAQENDASLVLRARYGADAVLLTGDLEASGVAELLAKSSDTTVNLLKLPHHGSRKSSPEKLVDRFRPAAAFVSAGFANSYRFPHADVVDMLMHRQIPLYRTDLQGTLCFSSKGKGWRIEQWRKGFFRTVQGGATEAHPQQEGI